METYELESEVRAALVDNAELMAVLPSGANSIYHYVAPTVDPKKYPIIVYSPITDVAALRGDDWEIAHRVTIKIYVIATQKRFALDEKNFIAACRLVKETMTGLNFVRRQTTPSIEDGKIINVLEFIKNIVC